MKRELGNKKKREATPKILIEYSDVDSTIRHHFYGKVYVTVHTSVKSIIRNRIENIKQPLISLESL